MQKSGSLLFKKRKDQAASSFLHNNDPVFCNLLFDKKNWVPHLFSGSQTNPAFYNKNQGQRLTGRLSPYQPVTLFKHRYAYICGDQKEDHIIESDM